MSTAMSELYVETRGAGPAVVLVHGLGSSVRDWDLQVPALSARYRTIAIDLRGHGQTLVNGLKADISMARFAADVAGVIEREAAAPAFVVGISMGTAVALQLALDRPELVRGIALVNGGPEGLSSANPLHAAEIARRIDLVERIGMRALGESIGNNLLPGDTITEVREALIARWAQNDPAAYLASLRALVDWNVRPRLGELAVPIVSITADQDYSPVDYKAGYVAELRDGELVVIANSRHMTPHDQPEALSNALLGFLDRCSTQSRAA